MDGSVGGAVLGGGGVWSMSAACEVSGWELGAAALASGDWRGGAAGLCVVDALWIGGCASIVAIAASDLASSAVRRGPMHGGGGVLVWACRACIRQ